MKVGFFCFFLFFSSLVFGQEIVWTEDRSLNWGNFKAANAAQRSQTAAYSYCGIAYHVKRSSDPNGRIEIVVKSTFDEDKSWKKTNNLGPYLLKHEQVHFDIAEVFARILRRQIKEKIKKSSDYDRIFKTLYQTVYDDYRRFQEQYDRETNHSINKEQQAFYNQLVAKLLYDLKS